MIIKVKVNFDRQYQYRSGTEILSSCTDRQSPMVWKSYIEETDKCSESPVPHEGGRVNNGLNSGASGHGHTAKPILTNPDQS
jgi:hypothetical protein